MLNNIELHNYRNLQLELNFQSGVNLIVAPNGSGKSNLLEAIYLLSTGRVFRPVLGYQELIGQDGSFARAAAATDDFKLEAVTAAAARLQRKFSIDGKVKPVSKFVGKLPAVLFAPHSVELVAGDPASRRQDLDDYLSQMSPDYAAQIQRYAKVVKNRNAVLKNLREHNGDPMQLDYWTQEVTTLADQIVKARTEFISAVEPTISRTAHTLYHSSQTPELQIKYVSRIDMLNYREVLAHTFTQNQTKEIAVGQTLYGPHKDDYEIHLDGKNLRYLGSRGQQRLAVFVWKIAQLEFMREGLGATRAVFLVDDLMSELDPAHRLNCAQFLLSHPGIQSIVTAVDKTDVPEIMLQSAYLVDIM